MRLISTLGRAAGFLVLGALVTGCGGGGSANTATTPVTQQHGSAGAQQVVVTINIPGRTAAGTRNTKYVGSGTQSATFLVTPSSGTPSPTVQANCTSVCQATLAVFPGSNTFTVSLFDGQNGTGNPISTGSTTQTIVAGTNAVNITFNGVPASVAMSSNPISFTSGTSGTSAVTVSVLDADGNTIVAPGTFTQTIGLTSSLPSVTLSPTTLTAPGQNITATYDGTTVATSTNVTFSAAIGGGSPVGSGGVEIVNNAANLTLNPTSVTVTAAVGGSHTATATLSETGFAGTFTIVQNQCSANATISPTSGPGPSQVFTITGTNPTTFPTPDCGITFSDGLGQSVALDVTVN